MAASDLECPIGYAERLRNEIQSMAGYTFLEDKTADHGTFFSINDEKWLDLIVEQIEMEPIFEEKSTPIDCSGNQGDSVKNSANMMAFGGAITLSVSAASLF